MGSIWVYPSCLEIVTKWTRAVLELTSFVSHAQVSLSFTAWGLLSWEPLLYFVWFFSCFRGEVKHSSCYSLLAENKIIFSLTFCPFMHLPRWHIFVEYVFFFDWATSLSFQIDVFPFYCFSFFPFVPCCFLSVFIPCQYSNFYSFYLYRSRSLGNSLASVPLVGVCRCIL